MIKKIFFINIFLFIFFLYIPSILFSIYSLSKNKIYIREYYEDIKLKTDKVKLGYLPLYYPKNLRRFAEKYKIYPIGTIPNQKTYYCNEGYGLTSFKSDRFGLRNNDNNWNNILRKNNIFFIGDSFTQGACLPKEFTTPMILESKSNYNTINLGMAGNGPYEYLASLNTIVDPIINLNKNKNFVILTFESFDSEGYEYKYQALLNSSRSIISYSSGNIFPNKEYVESLNNLIFDNYPTSKKSIINLIQDYRLNPYYQTLTLVPIRAFLKKLLKDKYVYKKNPSIQAIKSLAKICNGNCIPIVSFIPHSSYWATENKGSDEYKTTLKNNAQKLGVKFVDASKVINKNDIKNYAPKGHHFSISGSEKYTNYLFNQIKYINNSSKR